MDPAIIVGICRIGGRVDLDLLVYSGNQSASIVKHHVNSLYCAKWNQWIVADDTAAPMASPCLTSAGRQTRSPPSPGLDLNDLQASPGTRLHWIMHLTAAGLIGRGASVSAFHGAWVHFAHETPQLGAPRV